MKAFETVAVVANDGSLTIPAKVRRRLSPRQRVRLLVVIQDAAAGDQDSDWHSLTSGQFLAGYAGVDAVYDRE
jgi:hypothetical protein